MKNKRIRLVSLFIVLILLAVGISASIIVNGAAVSPVIEVENKQVMPEEQFTASISLKNISCLDGKSVAGVQFNLIYDKELFTPVSAQCTSPEGFEGDFEVKDGYIICLLNDTLLSGITADGQIASVSFKVSSAAPIGTQSEIKAQLTSVCTPSAQDITQEFSAKDGKITIGNINVIRLSGGSRVGTSIAISNHGWETAETVIITNGYNFADALAGGPLSYALNAPVLLTSNKNELEADVLAEIEALNAQNVIILGGSGAVNAQIESQLTALDYTVERIAGSSRTETAVKIAQKLYEVSGAYPENVFIAYGYNYPDALAVSSVASIKGQPVLFAYSDGSLDKNTIDYLTSSGVASVAILGGTGAVGENCETNLDVLGINHTRIFGTSRYNTAFAIITEYDDIFTSNDIALATGTSFPDALAGGAFAAKKSIPVILVHPTAMADGLPEYIENKNPLNVYVFGGEGAVSNQTVSRHINF